MRRPGTAAAWTAHRCTDSLAQANQASVLCLQISHGPVGGPPRATNRWHGDIGVKDGTSSDAILIDNFEHFGTSGSVLIQP